MPPLPKSANTVMHSLRIAGESTLRPVECCRTSLLNERIVSMKTIFLNPLMTIALLLVGCSTTPVSIGTVGPGPYALKTSDSSGGSLQVYSALVGRSEGDDPAWFQHSDYYLKKNTAGKYRHVDNATGHYAKRPRTVVLAPGRYTVRAQAGNGGWVEAPVVIRRGETTVISLDQSWNPGAAPETEIVRMPDGSAVGWRG